MTFLIPLNIHVHLYFRICHSLLKIVDLAHTVANFIVRKAFDERGQASGVFSEVRECGELQSAEALIG